MKEETKVKIAAIVFAVGIVGWVGANLYWKQSMTGSQTHSTPQSMESAITTTTTVADATPKIDLLCIDPGVLSLAEWPYTEAIAKWNANDRTIFHVGAHVDCVGKVLLYPVNSLSWDLWGETSFYGDWAVLVALWGQLPIEHRAHVLCHELGHVLGQPHTTDASCMNPDAYHEMPTQRDLQEVRENPWNSHDASRRMGLR